MPSTDSSLIENLTYDELSIGQSAQQQRVLTLADIQAFAQLSGDVNPAHVDAEYAQGTRFHGLIAHGMWSGALISTLLGTEFPGPGTIYLQQDLKFHRPVHVGDTLTVSATVVSKDDATHKVELDCQVTNQQQEAVVTGRAVVKAPTQKVTRLRAVLPTLYLFDAEARLTEWVKQVVSSFANEARLVCAVVHPCDEASLRGALQAAQVGVISPVLVAPEQKLRSLAAQLQISLDGVRIENVPHSHAAAERAAQMAASGEVGMLMKGSLHTDELMRAVVNQPLLRTKRRLSHVFRFDIPAYSKPLLITDAAINIAPDLEQKVDIVCNAIELAHALGIACPKVALLSAVETVTPHMLSTLDAAALCKMAERGQITGAELDGPLAFDNAISLHAAQTKGIHSKVAGDADILLAPDIESANMLAKQLEYFAGAASCGVVLGARVPIALTSRADGAVSRLASAALAVLLARYWASHQP